MPTIEDLQAEIDSIKQRNARVETDKAWENSWTRKTAVLCLTYFIIALFMHLAGFQKPLTNAIVPTIGFLLSTLTVTAIKRIWIRCR